MKRFTAQEMRLVAKSLSSSEVNLDFDKRDIAAMLRQAADMMERMQFVKAECDNLIKRTDRCKTCPVCKDGPREMFRGGYCWDDFMLKGCDNYIGEYAIAQIDLAKRIRRTVGEWEEVKDE